MSLIYAKGLKALGIQLVLNKCYTSQFITHQNTRSYAVPSGFTNTFSASAAGSEAVREQILCLKPI